MPSKISIRPVPLPNDEQEAPKPKKIKVKPTSLPRKTRKPSKSNETRKKLEHGTRLE